MAALSLRKHINIIGGANKSVDYTNKGEKSFY